MAHERENMECFELMGVMSFLCNVQICGEHVSSFSWYWLSWDFWAYWEANNYETATWHWGHGYSTSSFHGPKTKLKPSFVLVVLETSRSAQLSETGVECVNTTVFHFLLKLCRLQNWFPTIWTRASTLRGSYCCDFKPEFSYVHLLKAPIWIVFSSNIESQQQSVSFDNRVQNLNTLLMSSGKNRELQQDRKQLWMLLWQHFNQRCTTEQH